MNMFLLAYPAGVISRNGDPIFFATAQEAEQFCKSLRVIDTSDSSTFELPGVWEAIARQSEIEIKTERTTT